MKITKKELNKYLLIFFGSILLLLLILPGLKLISYPKEGTYSNRIIKSSLSFVTEDPVETKRLYKIAESKLLPIYDKDLTLIPILTDRLEEELRRSKKSKEIEIILKSAKAYNLEKLIKESKTYLTNWLNIGVLKAEEAIPQKFSLKIISTEKITYQNIYQPNLLFYEELRRECTTTPSLIAYYFLIPNVKFNSQETKEKKEELKKSIQPVYVKVEAGEKIVGDGELVDRIAALKLKHLAHLQQRFSFRTAVGIALLLILSLIWGLTYLIRYCKQIWENNRLLALLFLLFLFFAAWGRLFCNLKGAYIPYLIPSAAFSILVAIMLHERLALFSSLLMGIILALQFNWRLEILLYHLAGSFSGIYLLKEVRTRGELLKAAACVAVGYILVIFIYALVKAQIPISYSICGLVNGVLVYFVVMSTLPLLENIFRLATKFKLMELSSLDAPLLKQLAQNAPGTYQHSINVGNLAEAAAVNIGAEPILVRAGGYYHDLGKMRRPEYFIENLQPNEESKHTNISPTLSAAILKSHVKEGIEIAEAHSLPAAIIDIIAQHHGTSLMTYFYRHAANNAKDNKLREEEFRYPGPKPTNKEAALIMLADAVEAAVRTLPKPSPQKIESITKKTLTDKLTDGQLDLSNITFKDISMISETFVTMLTRLYHSRIEYPH
jgi:putative nucleotidyltransferase with HDIG domain